MGYTVYFIPGTTCRKVWVNELTAGSYVGSVTNIGASGGARRGVIKDNVFEAPAVAAKLELKYTTQLRDSVATYVDSYVKDKTVGETVLSLTWESLNWSYDIFILRRPLD